MKRVYVDTDAETLVAPSIFLAGPTSRDDTPSWRPEALTILENLGFAGTAFVPEHFQRESSVEFDSQVEWEWRHLHGATVVLFWVPRKLDVWPAFTTNIEFGRYVSITPERCIYGRPPHSEKNKYLDWLYRKLTSRQPETELRAALQSAVVLAQQIAS